MRKIKILALLLCVTLMSTSLTGCGILLRAVMEAAEEENNRDASGNVQVNAGDYDYDYDYEEDTEYSDPYTIDDMDLVEFDPDFDNEDYGDEDYDVAGDMITVGSDLVGYIDLPSDYYPWNEAGGMPEGSVQYCDGTPYNIVSMVYYDMPDVSAFEFAQLMAGQFENDTAIDPDSLEMATVTLGGVEAYQIYCYYPADGQWLVIWMFESPYDDYIHYVSAEFLTDNFDFFEQIETSYRFTK